MECSMRNSQSEPRVAVPRAHAVLALADEVLHNTYLAHLAARHVGR